MAIFNYRARDKTGQEILGNIDAPEEAFVIKNLRQSGYFIVSIERESQFRLEMEALLTKITGRIRSQEVLFFVRQLSTLLKSGIPLSSAILSIKEQTKNKTMREILEKISKDIEAGVSLSDSLSKCPQVFSEYFVSMIRVGETGGILESVLDRLTQLLTQELEIRSRIKSAMSYPIVLVIVAVVIVTFILATVIPKFVTIFETYEAKLPLTTTILLAVSWLIRSFWYIPLLSLIVLLVWLKKYLKSEKGRYNFDTFLFKIPLFGQLYLKIIIAQFARTIGSLLKSGVPLLEALRVTEKTVSNMTVRRIIQDISASISKGESLSEPFKRAGLFPVMVIQMVSVGEKTGKLEQMLFDVANFYDQEVDYAIRNTTAVLEPILLLIMGSVVAFIALSVLMPIFNLIKVFRR